MSAPPPQPPRGTMSLYADLLGGGSTEAAPAPTAAKPEAVKNPGEMRHAIRRTTDHMERK